jgi:hypothetical protein
MPLPYQSREVVFTPPTVIFDNNIQSDMDDYQPRNTLEEMCPFFGNALLFIAEGRTMVQDCNYRKSAY